MEWLKALPLISQIVKAWRETVAFFTARENRQAGRNEVILEVKETSNAALQEADAARTSVSEHIASGGLRDDDGYRRD